MPFNTFTVASAVTPSVIETYVLHFLNRAPLRQKPTAHITYHEGIALVRNFLEYASKHTVEDLQSFTQQWIPAPSWVRTQDVAIPSEFLDRAAELVVQQLGEQGVRDVGGKTWWTWRGPSVPNALRAEWIEMKKHFNERKSNKLQCKRAILYVHGGAYYFGSVDEHRYQMQRHARKLNARVLAPRYRLAPQYPFPCGLHDCLAAYLFLLEHHPPNQILLAGDSAGGGMVLAILVTLRDQGMPMPAGSILLSPWSDLTHSFPSVAGSGEGDYIPSDGLSLYKPSVFWPPPVDQSDSNPASKTFERYPGVPPRAKTGTRATPVRPDPVKPFAQGLQATDNRSPTTGQHSPDKLHELSPSTSSGNHASFSSAEDVASRPGFGHPLRVQLDGKLIEIFDQIQLYTTNQMLSHPLVSPVLQPSLGGLPPMLIQVGGAELLRDEQIYLAHKAADPSSFPPSDTILDRHDPDRSVLKRYGPTSVQLQVWDDLCHVPHTLSFTRPAKYMYRGVAQFGFWAFARAQKQEVTRDPDKDDDDVSIISSGEEDVKANPALASPTSPQGIESPVRDKSFTPGATDGDGVPTMKRSKRPAAPVHECVGTAGDPLPQFKNNMIRQRISRHGVISPLEPASDIPALQLRNTEIGIIKPAPIRKYLHAKRAMDAKYLKEMKKVEKWRAKDSAKGYERFVGENPPPTSLASRRRKGMDEGKKKVSKSMGVAMWSGWGSKHDEDTIERAEEVKKARARSGPRQAGTRHAAASRATLSDDDEGTRAKRASFFGGGLPLQRDDERPATSRSLWRKSSKLQLNTLPQASVDDGMLPRHQLASPGVATDHPSGPGQNHTVDPMTEPAASEYKHITSSETAMSAASRGRSGTVSYPFKLRNAVWNPSTAMLEHQAPDGSVPADAVIRSPDHHTTDSNSSPSTPVQSKPAGEKTQTMVDASEPAEAPIVGKSALPVLMLPYFRNNEVSGSDAISNTDSYPTKKPPNADKKTFATPPADSRTTVERSDAVAGRYPFMSSQGSIKPHTQESSNSTSRIRNPGLENSQQRPATSPQARPVMDKSDTGSTTEASSVHTPGQPDPFSSNESEYVPVRRTSFRVPTSRYSRIAGAASNSANADNFIARGGSTSR